MFVVYHFLRIFCFNVCPSRVFFFFFNYFSVSQKKWLDSNFAIFNDLFCNYMNGNLEISLCYAFLGEGGGKSFQLEVEFSVSLEENNH